MISAYRGLSSSFNYAVMLHFGTAQATCCTAGLMPRSKIPMQCLHIDYHIHVLVFHLKAACIFIRRFASHPRRFFRSKFLVSHLPTSIQFHTGLVFTKSNLIFRFRVRTKYKHKRSICCKATIIKVFFKAMLVVFLTFVYLYVQSHCHCECLCWCLFYLFIYLFLCAYSHCWV